MRLCQGCHLSLYQQNSKVTLHYIEPKEIKISKEQGITHLTYPDNQILLASSKSSYGTKFNHIMVVQSKNFRNKHERNGCTRNALVMNKNSCRWPYY